MAKEKCINCGITIDYEPEFCCSEKDCGCGGLPIYPPLCDKCWVSYLNIMDNIDKCE